MQHVTCRFYSTGTLWSVMGQRMILREFDNKDLRFDTRDGRVWLSRDEMEQLVQSGDATVIKQAA